MEPVEPLSSQDVMRHAAQGFRSAGPATMLLMAMLVTAPGLGLSLARLPLAALFPLEWITTVYQVAGIGGGVLYVLGAVLAQGALTHATVAALEGRPTSAATSIRVAGRRLHVLAVVCAVTLIGVVLGSTILIAPGVFLAAILLPATTIAVVERTGPIQALGRSLELTRRHRREMVRVILSMVWLAGIGCCVWGCGVGYVVVTADLDAPTPLETPTGAFVGALVNHALRLALLSLTAACSGAAYFRLRGRPIGAPPPVVF
ncbi:MAG: hypothetical protein KC619_24515 [Myxococcales bacterium]|nr:hypothetical protein [Myxococcales bacterium]